MPRLLFPFRFGSVPAVPSTESQAEAVAATTPSRWANLAATATNWVAGAKALAVPRFEHVYATALRNPWSGGADVGVQSAYRINDEFPFLLDGSATFDSASSTP